ncbi:MAG: LysE family translocator [Gammaproteobacteria bacterium]|nr:MAG: LysE family translocator [Gammaproteobacteria bacterium]
MSDIYPLSMVISILTFAFTMAMTPGPNNALFLSSGLTFGYRATIPHIIGVIIGFPLMTFFVGIGLGELFQTYPIIFQVLKIMSFAYLLWMAYHMTQIKGGLGNNKKRDKPLTFIQAVLFQWVNPKAWIMAISSISVFTTSIDNKFSQLLIVTFLYFIVGFVSTNFWTLGGVLLKKFITSQKVVHIINLILAFVMVASVLPFMLH